MVKIEVQLSVLKCDVDLQLSRLTKISHSLKKALANLQKRENNYANTDPLQQNITFLENELKSKNIIIQSLLEAQNIFKKSEFPPTKTSKFRQPEINYSWSRKT